jgi:hypothetical protein
MEAPRIKEQVAAAPNPAEQAQQAKDRLQDTTTSRTGSYGATSIGQAPSDGTARY